MSFSLHECLHLVRGCERFQTLFDDVLSFGHTCSSSRCHYDKFEYNHTDKQTKQKQTKKDNNDDNEK